MSTETNNRGARKVRKGVVVSKMGTKSVVVEVSYREIHPVYGKVVTRTKKYHVHDEADTAKVGDTVTIMETRPMSATKRWRIVAKLGDLDHVARTLESRSRGQHRRQARHVLPHPEAAQGVRSPR